MFEGLLADNYLYEDIDECIDWIMKVLDDNPLDDFIQPVSVKELYDRLEEKILNKSKKDEKFLMDFLFELSDDEITKLYYKNNMIEFIERHQGIQDLIISIFENIENLDYAEDKETWFEKVPKKYVQEFTGKDMGAWNSFVNTQYFMDPNKVPKNIETDIFVLKEYIINYVFCKYLSVDRVYRLKNFKRKCVTVIDTDSNILSLDTLMNYIFKNVIKDKKFGRDDKHNEFIGVNMFAYIITNAVEIILLEYGKWSNIPEEFRPIFNMKNEFYFDRLVIGDTKKRYISRILLREGNLMNPPKYDLKGLIRRPLVKKFTLNNKVNCWELLRA